jgi:hypothetical protein
MEEGARHAAHLEFGSARFLFWQYPRRVATVRRTTIRSPYGASPSWEIEVPADRRAKLEAGLQLLEKSIDRLRGLGKNVHPQMAELLPDVEVYYKAVHDALGYQEFLRSEGNRLRRPGAGDRPAAGGSAFRRSSAVDDRDRPRGPRLRLEDRRLGAAVWAGRSGKLYAQKPWTFIAAICGSTAAVRR